MAQKTILLVDDEQDYLDALADALDANDYRVLRAFTVERALELLSKERVDLATIDIMLTPGNSLEGVINSQEAGIYLVDRVRKSYPKVHVFCISVVSDEETIRRIHRMGGQFLRKGETPLRTVIDRIHSRLTGVAYTTDVERRAK
jgi:DNA-binding response OmpR family regulator